MTILVTGATGFVGSWMTRHLIEKGHRVRILIRDNSDTSAIDDLDVERHIGDVTSLRSVHDAAEGADSIFHLAGVVGYSKAERPLMEKVNIGGTKNIVEVVAEQGMGRLLHFSSVVAIGGGLRQNQILNEKSPFNISHLNLGYFETKKAAEQLVRQAYLSDRIDTVIVNPSTIYGPGDAKKGSRGSQLKVARGKLPFYTSGGVNVISIKDVVEATYNAWENGRSGERYILAGENILIKNLFKMIADEAGVSPPSILLPNSVVHILGKIGDMLEKFDKKGPLNSENAWTATMFHWFDSSKAREELGLNPAPAKEAIRESVRWMKNNGLLK